MSQRPILDNLVAEVEAAGFCYAAHDLMRGLLEANNPHALSDWDKFAASWNDMPQDQYMADGGRYRRRRHATFSAVNEGEIKLEPHQPHYQSIAYNTLNGGIAREFSPIATDIVLGNTMSSILSFCQKIFGRLIPEGKSPSWHIELHQFRIEAGNGKQGRPTPEGVHRDGVDFVLVMMVRRENISSGITTMHDLEQRRLDSFTLVNPLDCAIVNDKRCMHGVTAVEQMDPDKPAYRDVLVVTFRNIAN
jgi:hypothetical protein